MAFNPAAVLAQIAVHAFHLLHYNAGVMQQRASGWRQLYAFMAAVEQEHAEYDSHTLYTFTGRSRGDMAATRSFGDGARFVHAQEQAKVGQIKAHGRSIPVRL